MKRMHAFLERFYRNFTTSTKNRSKAQSFIKCRTASNFFSTATACLKVLMKISPLRSWSFFWILTPRCPWLRLTPSSSECMLRWFCGNSTVLQPPDLLQFARIIDLHYQIWKKQVKKLHNTVRLFTTFKRSRYLKISASVIFLFCRIRWILFGHRQENTCRLWRNTSNRYFCNRTQLWSLPFNGFWKCVQ